MLRRTSLVLVLTLVASACQQQPAAPTGSGAASAPAGPAKPTGTVTVAYSTFSFEELDPTLAGVSGKPYYWEMYDPLIGAGPDGKADTKYGLLESYEISPDALSMTMTLRHGALWQDGTEITSDDVKFTFEYSSRKEAKCTSCAFLRANMAGIDVVDKYTAKLRLKSPNVTLVSQFAPIEGDLAVLPKKYVEKVGGRFSEEPMGSGPWKFSSRKLGQFVEYVANESYWNKERIPGFQRLRVLVVPDPKTRVAMVRAGEADLIDVGPDDVAPLRKDGFKTYGIELNTLLTMFFFKSYDPTFLTNKIEFRKALILSVDTDAIYKAVYSPEVASRPSGAPLFDPLTPGYDQALRPYPYDVNEAKRLLQQIGYAGQPVNFWSFAGASNPEQPQVNELIADYWRKAGINVKLMPVEFNSWSQRYRAEPQNFQGPADVGVMFPGARPSLVGNIQVYMESHTDGGTVAAYHDPAKAKAQYTKITGTQDAAERDRLLLDLDRQTYDEYWAFPIVWRNGTFASNDRIAGWQPSKGTALQLSFETLKPSGK